MAKADTRLAEGVVIEMPVDLARFETAPLAREPFDHVVVPGFIGRQELATINRDFPPMTQGGSFPASLLKYGPHFQRLLDCLQSAPVAAAFGTKFGIDLSERPTMVTVRGHSRAKDGRIHTDAASKLVTALIYLNDGWEAEGGRLRLLRQDREIEDYVVEIPPEAGTLLAFRCTPTAYHGHKPFVGARRSLQLNWVTSRFVVRKELLRHSLSALTKHWYR